MPMNVQPIPTLSDRVNEIRLLTAAIVNQEILPNENQLWARAPRRPRRGRGARKGAGAARAHQGEGEAGGPLGARTCREEYGGCGPRLPRARVHERGARLRLGAASLFGVVAPNSGNQTILVKYGTEEQKKKWLVPLIEGKLESGFSMTEPDSAGSDPRSLKTTARRDGDEWVINGHKWFTSNGKRADFFIVMCRTEDPRRPGRAQRPDDPDHRPDATRPA